MIRVSEREISRGSNITALVKDVGGGGRAVALQFRLFDNFVPLQQLLDAPGIDHGGRMESRRCWSGDGGGTHLQRLQRDGLYVGRRRWLQRNRFRRGRRKQNVLVVFLRHHNVLALEQAIVQIVQDNGGVCGDLGHM